MNRAGSGRATAVLSANGEHRYRTTDRRARGVFMSCVATLATALMAVTVTAFYRAETAYTKSEAETMTSSGSAVLVHSDGAASGGKGMAFFTEGSASTIFSGELTSVDLRARETYCDGHAKLRIFVDGLQKGTVTLASSTYGNYPLRISRVGAGNHRMRIEYVDDRMTNECDRDAFLDYVTLNPKDGTRSSTTPPATYNPFAGEKFYADPDSNAQKAADRWYANGRTADARQMEKIARGGDIFYFSEWTQNTPGGTATHVDWQTDQIRAAGALPVYGVYALPHRDCGAYSSGGFKTGDQYKAWIDAIVRGLQGRKAIVIVEPDGISSTDCLSSPQLQERFNLIHYAVNQFESHGSYAYIDAANCFAPDSIVADRLNEAGIADATGFARNVSNFCWTQSEVSHGKVISAEVGGKPFVIDTSRNGLGPYQDANNWCNPPGRALGPEPTAHTGDPLVHAFYWLKRPDESDGTCNGYPAAGTWLPEYALGLARRDVTRPE